MILLLLVCSLSLAATGQKEEDDWIDPYDMLNYDASTKTMKKPAESENYPNVPTKRREYSETEQTQCDKQVADLQKQVEEQKNTIKLMSQQPTCAPVFKRFLKRVLNEMERVGMPSDSSDLFYDAKVKLSKHTVTEIKAFLEGQDSSRLGALDNAVSQILVELRAHNYEAWKWRFEDSFGVELDTVLKMGLSVLIIVAIICTQLWSTVSWFIQFSRLFAVCFFISIIWNWFYLYKIAFADHLNKMAKMDGINEKCTGLQKINWVDSLKEVFRSTLTLQDDPCKKYYELIMVNPILLVPPIKAISVTFTTMITEPLKHVGQGISEFLRALLQDLPITLQIPVLLTIMLCIMVCMYGGVQSAFQYGILAPFRRPRREPPPEQLEQPQQRPLGIEYRDHLAGGDAPQHAPRHRADDARLHRNQVHQRRPNRPRNQSTKVVVETLRTAYPAHSEDETDAAQREEEQNVSAESDPENQQDVQEEPAGVAASSVDANKTKSEPKPRESDPAESNSMDVDTDFSRDGRHTDGAAGDPQPAERRPAERQPAERQPSQTNVQDPPAPADDRTPPLSLSPVETVGISVQETSPTAE
ncbi:chloride channel CLIC-like protein 1 isoform X2 [Larimichthys crocea]|uniref:chloride channel CLIC-like protein 1 isoform X2 n=1 Tax=Larimichthys crocea TaxID=215358 RepID=UPI000F5F29E7|nr:chloride channel CLIC-like protein 1 isoform X2 [Larimichthys crocea]